MNPIETELSEIRRRIARIEEALHLSPNPTPRATPEPASSFAPSPGPVRLPPIPESARVKPASGSFLATVAVVCFLLAGVFLVRMAIETGWLTPFRQFGLTVLFGALLVAAAFGVRRKEAEYSGYLAASGVVVLYFAAYGGHLFFQVLDPLSAMVAVGAVGILSLVLRRTFDSELFSVTAAAGVFVGPVLIGRTNFDLISTCSYYVLWSVVFSLVSTKIRSRTLTLVAAYCAFGGIGLIALKVHGVFRVSGSPTLHDDLWLLLATQTLQFVIYLWGVARYSLAHDEPLTEGEAWAYFPVLLFFYGTEYFLLDALFLEAAPWISLGFAAVMAGVIVSVKSRLKATTVPSQAMLLGFSAVLFFHSFYLRILPESARPWLLVLTLLAVFLGNRGEARPFGISSKIVGFVFLLISAIEVGKLFSRLMHGDELYPVLLGTLTSGLLLLIFATWPRNREAMGFRLPGLEISSLVLGIAHSLAVLSLFRISHPHGSLAVSGSWAIYAVAILAIAFKLMDAVFARSSVFVLLVAVGKVFLYDLSSSTAAIRVLCLMLTGALLYLAGFLFRRIDRFA